MTPTSERAVLHLGGEDPGGFLQGLVSNDISGLSGSGLAERRIVHAALLTPQGKYLSDFFVVAAPDGLWLDAPAAQVADLLKRLTLYRMRKPVTIACADVTVCRGTGPAPDGALPDPRHPAMGWRLYAPGPDAPPVASDDGTDWDALRVAHTIPEAGVELIPEESFILECGFDRLHGVDFRKGCYVGQEVTARMRHKTELRKGLVTVRIDGAAPVGTPITAGGKSIGTLYTQAGDKAIAWLRFDRAERAGGPLMAGEARVQWEQPAAAEG